MNSRERRQYKRKPTDVGITIFKNEESIPATVIDVCEGGFGIHCKRAFFPGTKIYLKIDDGDGFGMFGTIKWAVLQKNKEISYRMGIQVEKIVIKPEDGAVRILDRPEYVKKLIIETLS